MTAVASWSVNMHVILVTMLSIVANGFVSSRIHKVIWKKCRFACCCTMSDIHNSPNTGTMPLYSGIVHDKSLRNARGRQTNNKNDNYQTKIPTCSFAKWPDPTLAKIYNGSMPFWIEARNWMIRWIACIQIRITGGSLFGPVEVTSTRHMFFQKKSYTNYEHWIWSK